VVWPSVRLANVAQCCHAIADGPDEVHLGTLTGKTSVIVANVMEQCSLFLPLQRGAGPMALILWLDWVT
jgi:hypothetical protein